MLGALLIFGCRLAVSYPSPTEDDDMMLNDDYDYNDEQSSPNHETDPPSIASPAKPIKSHTLKGVLGENVVLKCGVKIEKQYEYLWYKDAKLISNGHSVILPNFSINSTTYDLTILRSSPQSAGDYYCHVEPSKAITHTKVVLSDDADVTIIMPESSKSGQSSIYGVSLMWPLSALLLAALQHYKH